MKAPSRDALFIAQVAGLAGAVAMAATMSLGAALFMGRSALFPARLMGALISGEAALDRVTASAMAAGMFAHFTGPTLFWSRVYGLLRGWDSAPPRLSVALLTGLGVCVAAELLNVRLLLPAAQRALHGRNLWLENVPPALDWAGHLAFGLTLGAVFFLLRRRG
ncbi:MAG: hypothetical protein ACYC8T_25275 [Myxococcaceae bacterium]